MWNYATQRMLIGRYFKWCNIIGGDDMGRSLLFQ